ncbi:MAG TPA: hypothetical protein O0X32_01640 [Methanocorpusculum sp.]|nr:hypothetical protein [Methanocorpusculum sp.]
MNNFGKTIGVSLVIVLMVLAVFAGAGAAITPNQMESSLSSNEFMFPSQEITASVSFVIDINDFEVGDKIEVSCGFNTQWKAELTASSNEDKNRQPIKKLFYKENSSEDFVLLKSLDGSVTVKVTLDCTVPSSSEGSMITPLTVEIKDKKGSQKIEAKTNSVRVYNFKNLDRDKSQMQQDVKELNKRIATYKTYNKDYSFNLSTSELESLVSLIQDNLSSATPNSGDGGVSAIIAAKEKYKEAVKLLNQKGMSGVKYLLSESQKLIKELEDRNDDVSTLQSSYNRSNDLYNSYSQDQSKSIDATKIDDLLKESHDLIMNSHNAKFSNPLLKLIPIIIVITGIVSIVTFLIIRRKKSNKWDELG